MGQTYKADLQVDNGTDYDKYNLSTSADQVSYTKNGKETNVQAELDAVNTGLTEFIGKSTPIRKAAGDLFDTTYGNGWYYFADQSINTPETYGICFVLNNLNGWSFRLVIGTTKFVYTNVNIGQGFGTWAKL